MVFPFGLFVFGEGGDSDILLCWPVPCTSYMQDTMSVLGIHTRNLTIAAGQILASLMAFGALQLHTPRTSNQTQPCKYSSCVLCSIPVSFLVAYMCPSRTVVCSEHGNAQGCSGAIRGEQGEQAVVADLATTQCPGLGG